jgi:hypothetical protein
MKMDTIDVVSPARDKDGRFAKIAGSRPLISPTNPLLRLATVALATAAVVSTQPSRAPSELHELSLRQKRSAVDLMIIFSTMSIVEANDMKVRLCF